MLAWKIGPALATGNTIIMKTAEQTPLSALVLANLVKEAGFPAGVFNLLSGFGKVAGAAISAHMDIDKVAFTGSTLVGRTIMKAAASSNLKKVTLELGGKSPNIVFNDADIEQAISWVNFGIYFNHGQCCCAGTRIFVQEGIYDQFLEAFKKRAQQNKVGDPFAEDTFQGPQVSQLQYDRIMSYIKSGKDEGATVEVGGERHGDKGYFIQPTIFSNVRPEMKIMQEEIFGPVCAISKFKDEEEVIRLSNETTYGLAAAIHTKDLNTSIRVSNALKAGTVWVNCEFCALVEKKYLDPLTDSSIFFFLFFSAGYNMLSHQLYVALLALARPRLDLAQDALGILTHKLSQAIRWFQGVRNWSRAWRGCVGQLHPDQECCCATGRTPLWLRAGFSDVGRGREKDYTMWEDEITAYHNESRMSTQSQATISVPMSWL